MAAVLNAPQSAAQQHTIVPVTVRGLAYDSLRGKPLGNAFITLVGGSQSTTTDARGRFRFDSVAPGLHTFTMLHAMLDSLGFPGVSTRATITNGRDEVTIAVPSFQALWRVACGARPPPNDSGFVYGTIRDARSREPVANATVDLTWVDIDVSNFPALKQRRWHNRTRTDASGDYESCGVPTTSVLRVQATLDSTASGLIDLPPRMFRVQRRDLLIGAATELDSARHGTIKGWVTHAAGGPFAGARIVMDEAPEVRSGADGAFTIRNVPPGTRQVEIFAIGMMPVMRAVDVGARDTVTLTAELRKVTTLDVVRVTGTMRSQHNVAAFEERRRMGFAYAMDSAVIAARGTFAAAFGGFPSVQVDYPRNAGTRFTISLPSTGPGRCSAHLFIDGIRQRDQEDLGSFHTDEIAAVEVYPHRFSVPSEFMVPNDNCGVVAVWTKWAFR